MGDTRNWEHMAFGSLTDHNAVVAVADLCARTGATSFEVGYLDDDVPSEQARWYAQAQFRGARVVAEEKRSPAEAADVLARKLLQGGECTNCGRKVRVGWLGPSESTSRRCRWWRDGAAWIRGCDGKRKATRQEAS